MEAFERSKLHTKAASFGGNVTLWGQKKKKFVAWQGPERGGRENDALQLIVFLLLEVLHIKEKSEFK